MANGLKCKECNKLMNRHPSALYCFDCVRERGLAKNRYKMDKQCLFCGDDSYTEVHHVDRDTTNNQKKNLVTLCPSCHTKLHSKIYNVFLRRIFKVLREERYTFEEIGSLFGTTKQNVHKMLKGVDN